MCISEPTSYVNLDDDILIIMPSVIQEAQLPQRNSASGVHVYLG